MSLVLGVPALNASRVPSVDQAGWETGGSSSVSRRTSAPFAASSRAPRRPAIGDERNESGRVRGRR